jgi:serine/threonine-protein kinase
MLLDFGFAMAIDSTVETELGTLKGKIAYMAPEHVVGTPIDRRTDIYATGVLLWEAFAGRRMWKGVPEAQIVARLVAGTIPDVREANPDAPPEVAALLARALAPRRDARFATALEFKEELDAIAATFPSRGSREGLARVMVETFTAQRETLRAQIDDLLSGKKPPIDRTGEHRALPMVPAIVATRPSERPGSSVEPTSSTLGRARITAAAAGAAPPRVNRVLNLVALACTGIAIVGATGAIVTTLTKPQASTPPSAVTTPPSVSVEPPPIVDMLPPSQPAPTANDPKPAEPKPADGKPNPGGQMGHPPPPRDPRFDPHRAPLPNPSTRPRRPDVGF